MKYNLYYTLNKSIKKKDLTKEEKNELLSTIPKLSNEEKKAFFLLIHEHALNTESEFLEYGTIPYNGKETSEGIEFNLTKIPKELRHILYKFTTMIMQQKNEEQFTIL